MENHAFLENDPEVDQYFMDANVLIADLDEQDSLHKKVRTLLQEIDSSGKARIFVSDVIVNEALSVLGKRCESRNDAKKFQILVDALHDNLRKNHVPVLCLYEIAVKNFQKIIGIMRASQGHLNFHDALIALFLKEVPNVTLLTFDQDFKRVPGLKVLP